MNRKRACILAGCALIGAAGYWLAAPLSEQLAGAGPTQPGRASAAIESRAVGTPTGLYRGGAGGTTAAAGPAVDAFLIAELRFKFEEMLLEAGEARSPAELKQRLAALIHRHFSAADAVRALALLERYVDYRVALGDLKPPADPRALRQSIAARQQLRERHFAQDEHLALFAADDELDRYTLARLEIGRNAGLTAAQKEAGFNNAERELTAASRTARADSIAHVAVAAQTAAFEVQGASEHERHALRRAQYGDAAALQLAQLDREERDWQARLSHYAGAKERGTDGVQLEQVRQLLFSAQEQLRIDAALALRSLQAQAPARQ